MPLVRISTRMSWSFSARAGLMPVRAGRVRRAGPTAVVRQQIAVAALRSLLREARPRLTRRTRVPVRGARILSRGARHGGRSRPG
ncbi:hypothetical protein [Streptomyces sp. NPDC093094]|uniref:hypothetical protein n=1 Tax=Streptomyces sp. NPDC093094 TaxID=3366026 RepID=UPI00381B348C